MPNGPVVLDPDEVETAPAAAAPNTGMVSLDADEVEESSPDQTTAGAELNRALHGNLDRNAPLNRMQLPAAPRLPQAQSSVSPSVSAAPSLGPAPAQSVDDQEANRLLPNQPRYVAREAVPEPKTVGDLITNASTPVTTDVVPGTPVHLAAPANARDVASATDVTPPALPSIAPHYAQEFSSVDPTTGAPLDAGGQPIGASLEGLPAEAKGAVKDLRDGLRTLGPILAASQGESLPGGSKKPEDVSADDAAGAVAKIANSVMTLSTPLLAYEILHNPAAGPALLAGIKAGQFATPVGEKIAKAMGAGQGVQALSGVAAGLGVGVAAGAGSHIAAHPALPAQEYLGEPTARPAPEPAEAPIMDAEPDQRQLPATASPASTQPAEATRPSIDTIASKMRQGIPLSADERAYMDERTRATSAPVELAPDEVQQVETHPLGKVTGIDHQTGLPIVDRTQPSEAADAKPAQEEAPAVLAPERRLNNSGDPREEEFLDRTQANGSALVQQYIKDNTKNGVLNIATDAAKELFPEYVADRTGHDRLVHSSASAIADAAQKTALSTPPEPGKDIVRIVTASPGSGKTTGLASPGDAQVGLDIEAILRKPAEAIDTVQSVIDSGRRPQIQWVFVENPAETVRRMIGRAAGDGTPEKPGIGRTVQVKYMADAYDKIPDTLEALKKHFGDKLDISVIDNSGPKGTAKLYTGERLDHFIARAREWKGRTGEVMDGELEKLRAQGKVPDAIYRAATAVEPDRGGAGAEPQGRDAERPGDGGQHEQPAGGLRSPLLESPPVGSTEPGSGRVVTQPTDKLPQAQELATQAAPELKQKLASIASTIPGANKISVREAKNPARAREKAAKEGQPVETISDLLAARVSADSPAAHERIVAGIRKQFQVLKDEDRFTKGDPNYGYRSHTLQVRMGNGSTAEVQIVPKEILAAENQTHGNYKAGRAAEMAGRTEDAQAAMSANRALHDAAMAKFNARNGLLAKGTRVRMQDGALGTVDYSDSQMKIVRVRTDDGRNITVPGEKVEVVDDRNGGGGTALTKRSDEQQSTTVSNERDGATVAAGEEEGGDQGGSQREGVGGNAEPKALTGGGATPQVGKRKVEMAPTSSLNLDPKRFQYKLNTSSEGVTDLLKGKRWNEDLAGVLSVWRDPEDGKLYVVNGHHRADLAIKQNAVEHNVPEVAVKYINAPDASTARSIGALQNIAEGRGTALDAAKYFRDAGIGPDELSAKGISMREATAENGLALSRLMPSLFDEVVSGRMTESRGISIGKAAPLPEQQEAVVKMIGAAENRGRTVTNATIEELGRMARNAGVHREKVDTLFGTQEQTRSIALEKAEVSDYVRKKIASERKLFSHVADKGRAEALDKAGNTIATSKNARVAERAAQDEKLYDRLAGRSGPINDILEKAAAQLAGKSDDAAIKRDAYTQIRKSLDSLRGSEGERADGVQEAAGSAAGGEHGPGDGRGELEPAAVGEFARSRVKAPPSLALPGFEQAIGEQHEAAETERGNQLTAELTKPKGNINKAAGEMERKSPLFSGSEANPQPGLFNQAPKGWEAIEAGDPDAKEVSRNRTREENVAGTRFSVTAGSGNHGAVITLSHDGMSFLEKAIFGRLINAVHLTPKGVGLLVRSLRLLGRGDLADFIESNRSRDGGAILARPDVGESVLREEHWHDFQNVFPEAHRAGVERAKAAAPEAFQRAAEDVRETYRDADDATIEKEVFAKIAAGSDIRISDADKQALHDPYIKGIAETNGGIMDHVPDVAPERGTGDYEASTDRQGDRQNYGASEGGVSQGRTDLARELRPGLPDGSYEANLGPVGRWLGEQADLVKVSREIHGGLQDLDPKYDADVLRAVELMKRLPGTPADQEQTYHALENPKEPTTPVQRQIMAMLAPMRAESEALFRKLYPNRTISGDYVHRIAQQKGGLLDRILKGSQSTGRGNVLKKNAAAGQKRSMMALESPTDKTRQVVSVGRGRVTAWQNSVPSDIGGLRSGMTTADAELDKRLAPLEREEKNLLQEQRTLNATLSRQAAAKIRLRNIDRRLQEIDRDKTAIENQHLLSNLPQQIWKDKNGKLWQFKQATTKEIEAHTPIEYYKNAAASTVTNWLELRKADRANTYLEKLKASPGFSSIGVKPADPGQIPEGWQATQLPQLMGYYFEPHVAEVFDRYAKDLAAGDPNVLAKVNSFLTTSIFLNPIAHLPNLTANWLAEKGLGILNPFKVGSELRAGLKAFNAVAHQNGDFLSALDAGAPMHSQRLLVQKFAGELIKKLQAQATNPGVLAKLQNALGTAINIPHVMQALVDAMSSKITWPVHDMYILQSAYAKMGSRNMTLEQALRDTANYIPNERLPTRVFNSASLAKLLNSDALMFTHYHYGVLKAWGQVLKNAVGAGFDDTGVNAKGQPVNAAGRTRGSERGRALSIAAGLAVMSAVVYPLIDKLLQEATGNKDARVRRPGLSTTADNAIRVAEGDESPLEALRSVATPSVLAETAADLAFNRDLLGTQRKIYNEHGSGKEIAQEAGTRVAEAVSPAQLYLRASASPESTKRMLLGLAGVSFPQHGAMRMAAELRASHFGDEAETPEDRRKAMLRSQARYLAWQGDLSGIAEARKSGLFTAKDIANLYIASKQDPLVYEANGLGIEDLLKLAQFRGTTPEERRKLLPLILRKAGSIQKAQPSERDGLRQQLHAVMGH